MTEIFKAQALSVAAFDVLGQLYADGPTWDGNVISKSGRDEIVRAGLAWHESGYANLTPEGVRVAAGWDRAHLRRDGKTQWLHKQSIS